jgi:hypothetical protein
MVTIRGHKLLDAASRRSLSGVVLWITGFQNARFSVEQADLIGYHYKEGDTRTWTFE